MGYLVLFIFYVMVAILTLDMSRNLGGARARNEQPKASSAQARRPRPALVSAYGRALRARRLTAFR